jgi:hypothetical protein
VLDVTVPERKDCRTRNRAVFEWLRANPSIGTVVLVGYWASPANARIAGLAAGLERTVTALQAAGRHVVVIGAVPPNPFQVPRYLAHAAQRGTLADAKGIRPVELDRRTAYMAPVLARLRAKGVTVIEPKALLCGPHVCDIYRGKEALYFDSHHLSLSGARLVAARLNPLFAKELYPGEGRGPVPDVDLDPGLRRGTERP